MMSTMTSRALVLGGGGVTGVAWEFGVLTGLAEAGIDLTEADVVVGTSAGSVVGAQVAAGIELEKPYARQLADASGEIAARLRTGTLLKFGLAMLGSREPAAFRARVGRMALAANTVPAAERRAVIEARLPVRDWPERRLLITAVDADTGELVVFDRDSGVPLVDAVAASCAVPGVWPAVTVNGRRLIDGGMRSGTNADLAAGYERVVIVAPIPAGYGAIAGVARHVAELAGTAKVAVVAPDAAARQAIGRNVLDPARRAGAARAGRAQAAAAADAVRAVWS
jgi:NTE family protein